MINSIHETSIASRMDESKSKANLTISESSELYQLNKNTKRWRSMYALRDSIRNLTSCVSSKASFMNKKNIPTIKINEFSNDYLIDKKLNEEEYKDGESSKTYDYYEDNQMTQSIGNESDMEEYTYDYGTSMQSVKNCDYNNYIGSSISYLKCKTSDNLYASNVKLDENLIGNASNLLVNNSMFKSCNFLSSTNENKISMSPSLNSCKNQLKCSMPENKIVIRIFFILFNFPLFFFFIIWIH